MGVIGNTNRPHANVHRLFNLQQQVINTHVIAGVRVSNKDIETNMVDKNVV